MAAGLSVMNLLRNSLAPVQSRYLSRDHFSNSRRQNKSMKLSCGKSRKNVFAPLVMHPKMKPEEFNRDIEWASVYQTAKPFNPYLIPLPIRMGRPKPGEVPPKAIGNVELLKIPNFFHLTPPAIEKHCEALKKLCTPWPANLPNLPLRILTKSYVSPSHNIRHEGARVVYLTFSLKDLNLSSRSREKMIALADHRYNPKKDEITLLGKECPTRKQNTEYVLYLMKVLYMESTKQESWEKS